MRGAGQTDKWDRKRAGQGSDPALNHRIALFELVTDHSGQQVARKATESEDQCIKDTVLRLEGGISAQEEYGEEGGDDRVREVPHNTSRRNQSSCWVLCHITEGRHQLLVEVLLVLFLGSRRRVVVLLQCQWLHVLFAAIFNLLLFYFSVLGNKVRNAGESDANEPHHQISLPPAGCRDQ